jgi:POT family proton-dependent oligopeptide transporter
MQVQITYVRMNQIFLKEFCMTHNQYPPSLPVFFLTELWERYGFYVIQTLLTLYLSFHFNWPDTKVYSLVGSFTALTYLSPFIGGLIADRYLGQKNTILLGAIVLFISYLILGASHEIDTLIKALASISIGTGLLKPNISCLLGNQFPSDSIKREQGFTIFYLGITTGIILGTTLPSVFQTHFGWQVAFYSAAFGMVLSFISFSFGMLKFDILDYAPRTRTMKDYLCSSLILIFLWPLTTYILLHQEFANFIFPGIAALSLSFLLHNYYRESSAERHKTLIILYLCCISVMFWTFYFQMFMSLALFIKRLVLSHFLGVLIPPPYYVTIESIGMLVIGYLITKSRSGGQQTREIANKFSWSIAILALTYLSLVLICYFHPQTQGISPLLMFPLFLLISLAELLLSPVGIAAISMLSSQKNVSTMMGIFFVSLGLGGYLSGRFANLTAIPTELNNLGQIQELYTLGFTKLFLVLILCLFITLALRQRILKLS